MTMFVGTSVAFMDIGMDMFIGIFMQQGMVILSDMFLLSDMFMFSFAAKTILVGSIKRFDTIIIPINIESLILYPRITF